MYMCILKNRPPFDNRKQNPATSTLLFCFENGEVDVKISLFLFYFIFFMFFLSDNFAIFFFFFSASV